MKSFTNIFTKNEAVKLNDDINATKFEPKNEIYMIDANMFKNESIIRSLLSSDKSAFSDPLTVCELIDKADKELPIKIIINTEGGELTALEKILKKLLKHPKGYIVYIKNECYSAGALLSLGADEIVMNDDSYLGKIDPQNTKSGSQIIYATIDEKYIGQHNIYKVKEAQHILNYMKKILCMIYDINIESDKNLFESVLKHMVYSELPHCTLFDNEECKTVIGLNIRSPNNDENTRYFDNKNKLKVKKFQRV